MRKQLLHHWAKLSCLEENCQTMLEVQKITRAITLAYQYKKMKTPLLNGVSFKSFTRKC